MSDEPEILEEPTPAQKKPEGIEHDPYEWGQCSVSAHIVWTPGSSAVMVGVRTHLDAPIVTALYGDELVSLPGHAAELRIPTSEAIADLLAQLREELPLRARAKAERVQTNPQPASPRATRAAKPAPPRPAPAAQQVSLFNFTTGETQP